MVVNPIVGVYIPIIRTPIKGGRSPIPNKTRLLTMAHMARGIEKEKGRTSDNKKTTQVIECGAGGVQTRVLMTNESRHVLNFHLYTSFFSWESKGKLPNAPAEK